MASNAAVVDRQSISVNPPTRRVRSASRLPMPRCVFRGCGSPIPNDVDRRFRGCGSPGPGAVARSSERSDDALSVPSFCVVTDPIIDLQVERSKKRSERSEGLVGYRAPQPGLSTAAPASSYRCAPPGGRGWLPSAASACSSVPTVRRCSGSPLVFTALSLCLDPSGRWRTCSSAATAAVRWPRSSASPLPLRPAMRGKVRSCASSPAPTCRSRTTVARGAPRPAGAPRARFPRRSAPAV